MHSKYVRMWKRYQIPKIRLKLNFWRFLNEFWRFLINFFTFWINCDVEVSVKMLGGRSVICLIDDDWNIFQSNQPEIGPNDGMETVFIEKGSIILMKFAWEFSSYT
jgi:hypothetical protein